MHNAVKLRKPNHMLIRYIGYVGFSDNGHKMVFAVREKGNVALHQHLLVIVFVFEQPRKRPVFRVEALKKLPLHTF